MNTELEQRISQKVFEDVGISIGPKDPIYALAVICREIIKEDKEGYVVLQDSIVNEIRDLPNQLSSVIHKVAAAVEDAEQTSKILNAESDRLLKAHAQAATGDFRKAIDVIARDQVAVALSQINLAFSTIEQKAVSITTARKGPTLPKWMIALVAACVFSTVCCLPPVLIALFTTNHNLEAQVTSFARNAVALDHALNTLPKATYDNIQKLAAKERFEP